MQNKRYEKKSTKPNDIKQMHLKHLNYEKMYDT